MMHISDFHRPMQRPERGLIGLVGAMLLASLLLPIWHVHLWSPQYPEGLDLFIHARDITGSLQNINILNHYIGMKPIATSSFPEFVWMGPAIAGLGVINLLAALTGRREAMCASMAALYGFCLYMFWDLYHWMYDWGHNLDPNAAINVPGFTPPVFGFKHIANFYVSSYPSFGGTLVVAATLAGFYALWHALRTPSH
jgi:copper chaperone NosL